MSEDNVYESKTEIPEVTTGQHILFNAGHTSDLEVLLPDLENQQGAETHQIRSAENTRQTLLTLTPDAITKYIEEHQQDKPHAVETIVQLICEETKQTVDPARTAKGIQMDVMELEEHNTSGSDLDPEEVEELKARITEGKKFLRENLAFLPKQLMAMGSLLSDEKFTNQLENYISLHGEQIRLDSQGRPTSETHQQFVVRHLNDMKTIMDRRLSQIDDVLKEDLSLDD